MVNIASYFSNTVGQSCPVSPPRSCSSHLPTSDRESERLQKSQQRSETSCRADMEGEGGDAAGYSSLLATFKSFFFFLHVCYYLNFSTFQKVFKLSFTLIKNTPQKICRLFKLINFIFFFITKLYVTHCKHDNTQTLKSEYIVVI